VALGAVRGARVIATASPASHEELRRVGAERVLDYHDAGWTQEAWETGVDAAVNAAPGQADTAIGVVRDGGRLATITSDPPNEQRSIQVSGVYVRPDGRQLQSALKLWSAGSLSVEVGWTFGLDDAARALETAIHGGGGRAVVLGL
jgi:NADPH:quinone reductase-like Zn-dependent oxidoreductase